jgi:hypothetical protein
MSAKREPKGQTPSLDGRVTALARVLAAVGDFDPSSQRRVLEAAGVILNVKLNVCEEDE